MFHIDYFVRETSRLHVDIVKINVSQTSYGETDILSVH